MSAGEYARKLAEMESHAEPVAALRLDKAEDRNEHGTCASGQNPGIVKPHQQNRKFYPPTTGNPLPWQFASCGGTVPSTRYAAAVASRQPFS